MTRLSTSPKRQPTEFDLTGRRMWPTMLFLRRWREYPTHAPGLIEHLLGLRGREEVNIASGVAVSSKPEAGLFESRMDLFDNPQQPDLRALVEFISDSLRQAISLANDRRAPPSSIEVDYVDAWFHVTNEGGYHDAHYHGGCSWCGIFYVQAGDAPTAQPTHAPNGVNRFYSPFVVGGMLDDFGSSYLRNNLLDIPPRDGQLVIFPSFLLHSALPYQGATDRIVIAFNTTSTVGEP